MAKFDEVLRDEKSLGVFLRSMHEMEKRFCENMMEHKDFTISLEVRGNEGELLHCRVRMESFDRPPGVEGEVEKKRKQRAKKASGWTGSR